MTALERALRDLYITHQIDLIRFEASARGEVMSILDRLGGEVERRLMRDDLTSLRRAAQKRLLDDLTDATDKYYGEASRVMKSSLEKLAGIEAQLLYVTMDAGMPTAEMLKAAASEALVQGAPSAAWWSRQAGDTAFRFKNEVRDGIASGQTTAEIARRVREDALSVSRKNAEALVRSSVQSVSNDARMEAFRQNSDIVIGVRQISTLDARTTEICMAYDGAEWDLDGNPINGTTLPFNDGPPRHWNCRSTLIPILAGSLGFDLSEGRQRATAAGPVGEKESFKEWLGRQPESVQNEMLGKGRAEMWRRGDITLQQLLDQRGNPLTLAQLEKLSHQRAMGVRFDEAKIRNVVNDSYIERRRRDNIEAIERELAKVGMEDYPVIYHSGKGYKFQAGGQDFTCAAYFRHHATTLGLHLGKKKAKFGELGFYVDTLDSVGPTVRHEAFHARFHSARLLTTKVDEFMVANREALIREDGTTRYSRAYWTGWQKQPDNYHAYITAVNESLAEMHATMKLTPTYQQLDDIITAHWKKTERKKRVRRADPANPIQPPVKPEPPKLDPPEVKPPPPVVTPPGQPLTLEAICQELGLDPKRARAKLRDAGVQKPGTFWVWKDREAAKDIIEFLKTGKKPPVSPPVIQPLPPSVPPQVVADQPTKIAQFVDALEKRADGDVKNPIPMFEGKLPAFFSRDKFELETVRISQLRTTQDFLSTGRLKQFRLDRLPTGDEGLPLVVRIDGQLVLIDGNHRTVVSMALGQTEIKVRVITL